MFDTCLGVSQRHIKMVRAPTDVFVQSDFGWQTKALTIDERYDYAAKNNNVQAKL